MVAQIKKKRKQTPWHRLEGTTNFYPQYLDGARDRVTPIAPVQPNETQLGSKFRSFLTVIDLTPPLTQ